MTKSQVITCNAAVCWGSGQPLKVEEIQVDPPKSTEVRVKILYSSICHSDVLSYEGFPVPLYPRVLGHEGVGVVESVGDEVKEVKEGDVVIPTSIGECKECENCTSGITNLCLKYPLEKGGLMLDGTSRMSVRGQLLYQTVTYSTWCEYMVTDANYLVKVDPIIELSHASLLSCGYTTGFGSAWKDFKVEEGSSVAVFGLGAVGLGAIAGAKMQRAAKIIGIDKNPWKNEKGEAFGMTDFINPEETEKPISELLMERTNGIGVDYSFECSGIPSLLSEAIMATKVGKGKTMAIGVGLDMNVPMNLLDLVVGGRTLKGTIFGGIKPKSDLPIMMEKCKNKEFKLDQLLTHQVKLEEINKAIELSKQSDCVKVVIKI